MFDKPMQFVTTGPDWLSRERVRHTASGLVIVWIEDWPAGKIVWVVDGVACAGRGTSIDQIEGMFVAGESLRTDPEAAP